MNFRQEVLTEVAGVAALRQEFCECEMAEIQPSACAGFIQRLPSGHCRSPPCWARCFFTVPRPFWFGFRYIADLPIIPIFLLLLASLFLLFFSAFLRAGKNLLVGGLCLYMCAGVAFVYIVFGMTLSHIRVETSPSGDCRLLIVESRSACCAYPMVNAFMCRAEDDGCISCHDYRDGVGAPAVEWISETEARVWLPDAEGFLSVGSTEEIVVRFE